jgi:hypothetical protein
VPYIKRTKNKQKTVQFTDRKKIHQELVDIKKKKKKKKKNGEKVIWSAEEEEEEGKGRGC